MHFMNTNFSFVYNRCGNVAAILELDEHLQREFTIFEAAPQVCVIIFIHFLKTNMLIILVLDC